MTTEVQLALINQGPAIIIAFTSLLGAVAAYKGWRKSDHNGSEISTVKQAIANNDVKTEEVGRAVNGRMTALIEEIEKRYTNQIAAIEAKNTEKLTEAVKAARLDAEKIALAHVVDLKTQLAKAKSEKDIMAAIENVQQKLIKSED